MSVNQTDPEATQPIWPVVFENLRRLAGVKRIGTPTLREANGSRKSLFM